MTGCHTFCADQIFHHAPWNSCVATHRTHKLQTPNASRVGDSQGRLQDPVCQWDQVHFLCVYLLHHHPTAGVLIENLYSVEHVPVSVDRNKVICMWSLVCGLCAFWGVWRCHTESGQAPVIYPTALICLPSLLVSFGGQPCVQSQSTCLELPTFCLVLKAPQLDLCACLGSLSPWRNHPVVCVLCSGGGSMVRWVIASCRSISATIWSWLLT